MKKSNIKFSIIMSVFNVENYLEEAIDSVINQSIGFEENVELILVNDGSTDNSGNICERYKKSYTKNIIYLEKENGGLASAKNKGLDFASGEYVNFFDSDDILSKNTLEEVYSFFKRNSLCIDFVSIPLYFFEAEKGLHPKYAYMGHKNRIINLLNESYNFVLSGASCFYKREIFDNFRFDESYVGEEDTLLNGTIYLKNPQFGYVCERNVKYNYRKRLTKNSIVDKSGENPKAYFTVIKLLDSIIPKEDLLNYHKELIIYELRSRLKKINLEIFKDKKDYNYIMNKFKAYLALIDVNYLINKTTFGNIPEFRKLVLDLNDISLENDIALIHKVCLSKSSIEIKNVVIKDERITIDILYNNYGYKNLYLKVFDDKNKIYNPIFSKDIDSTYNKMYGSFTLDKTHLRRFSFSLSNIREIKFILEDIKFNRFYPIEICKINQKLPISSVIGKYRYKNYVIRFKRRKFIITRRKIGKFTDFKMFIRDFIAVLVKRKKVAFIRIFNSSNKKYILLSDRDMKAGDNAEALFKYIYSSDYKLSKNTYFVISKKSDDYKKLKKIGKVVALGSIKHKYLFINASHIYSSHTMFEYFNAFSSEQSRYYRDLFRYKFIWLQHGITQNDISYAANQYAKKIDYIIAATNAEYEEFKSDKYFYDETQVLLTGFSRFDLLESNSKDIITLAPTWRRGLGEKGKVIEHFEDTSYYKNFAAILSSEKLLNLLKHNNYTLKFLLHPEMSNYKEHFDKFNNKFVNIIDQKKVNYSEIFRESKLFITDYSSTFFDFAYLKKPEIFFQFDSEDFFKNHYKAGYFDHKRDGFGDVFEKPQDVVEKIEYYFNNNFKMEDKYINRVEKTFKYTDKNNCKRIIDNTYKK